MLEFFVDWKTNVTLLLQTCCVWYTYLIICLTGLIVPHALEASPKQTSTVLESNFRSKSDWSIVQDFLLKSSLLTSRPSRFSASLNHGDTFASWHSWDNMTLRWGKLGNVLMWSSSDLAMWKVNEVMLGPNVIWKRMKTQCNNGRKSILLANSYFWTAAFYEMFIKKS